VQPGSQPGVRPGLWSGVRIGPLGAEQADAAAALAARCGASFGTAVDWRHTPRDGWIALAATVLPRKEIWAGVCGVALGRIVADEAEVLAVAVAPDARRTGIGRRLASGLVDRLHADGALRVHLEVRASNAPAIELYTELGFGEVGRRQRYYVDGEDAVLLAHPPL
jgi:ribosomal-protein-alanine N-acetyltransferase